MTSPNMITSSPKNLTWQCEKNAVLRLQNAELKTNGCCSTADISMYTLFL